MDVSIVISTWNNARRLALTLESLAALKVPTGLRWEVVVVDNNCSDDTPLVVESFRSRLPVHYCVEPIQGLSHGRNRGIAESNGEWLLFTDDDVVLPDDWLATYRQLMSALGGGWIIGGPVRSIFEGPAPSAALLAYAPPSVRGLSLGPAARELTGREVFIAANWACTRAALAAHGGFSHERGLAGGVRPLLLGEETELMLRMATCGVRRWYEPRLELGHFVPAGKCSVSHIAWRAGAAAYEAVLREPEPAGGRYWFRIPRWEFRELAVSVGRWLADLALGRDTATSRIMLTLTRARMHAWRVRNARPQQISR